MGQNEINRQIAVELRKLAKEVWRSTQSQYWEDMKGILQRLDALVEKLGGEDGE